ncbi:hypothetical protein FOQG_16320 [Fusarium oxysporum f. sp. raphani 54005]|uniref:Uncharacterized protein n=1 Tax=Fusarium oxysporum f. sp. raphani 54005 TaxID=1089458 RepID=X0C8I8_FUSOX|nr:hypothetical protein FOQG_16320 [Fusarium oxysporum f. sp. raphani 54005]
MPRTIDWGEGRYPKGNRCEYDNAKWKSGYGYWILWGTDRDNGGVYRRRHWYCSISCRNMDAECCDCNKEDDSSEDNSDDDDDDHDDDEEEEDDDSVDCVCQEMKAEDEESD